MNTDAHRSFKQKALLWASQFEICCCFDSNAYPDTYSKFDFLLAAGAQQQISTTAGHAFEDLKQFYNIHQNWMFGMLSYDLKNEIEQLESAHENLTGFPDLFFFVPQYLIAVKDGLITVLLGDDTLLQQINAVVISDDQHVEKLDIRARMERETYISKVEALREHISRGHLYEVNFCQEFFAENASVNPLAIYQQLNSLSPTPFSGFFKTGEKYILSASPERFLCKRGNKLISQPIKGTARRSADQEIDQQIRLQLSNDDKERAENVMIVDLVRNDLTKSAVKGTVKVDELFGIYSFPQVHQMISTISCELDPAVHPVDAIRNTFPMGSMTGAPKFRAMQLIEETECSRRGMYSGAFGYMDDEGNFDFNVIIRSILYNETKKFLSFQVGGAITYAASAAAEYEECLLKASAMLKVLNAGAAAD